MWEVRKTRVSKPILAIETPIGHKLVLNILFGAAHTTDSTPVPDAVRGAILLQTRLRSGTAVVVLGRVLPFSDGDNVVMRRLRDDLGLRVNTDGPVSSGGVELFHVSASPTAGNVITVVPLGPEAWAAPSCP